MLDNNTTSDASQSATATATGEAEAQPATIESPAAEPENTQSESISAASGEEQAPAPLQTEASDQPAAEERNATASETDASAEAAAPAEDFGSILSDFTEKTSSISPGDIVRGKVVGITELGVMVDVGHKCEGFVPIAEFGNDVSKVGFARGDEIDVYIKSLENQEGYIELSRTDAVKLRAWSFLEKAFQDGVVVKGRVIDRIKGGLQVDVEGINAFLPGSLVDVRPVRNLEVFKGKELDVQIVKFNRRRGNVVVSRRGLLEEALKGKKEATLQSIDEGMIVEGQVKTITDYGVFIDLGGLDGLLHITDMTWGKLQNPAELFKVGEWVQVKVLKIDRAKERVSLGYKQLQPDPWSTVPERFPVGLRLPGEISNVTDYGAFVKLDEGVEGLVHVSEMTWSKRAKHPSKIVSVGQKVEVVVIEMDLAKRRIRLGLKQVEPNPWESLPNRYYVGQKITGKVRNLTDFGAFVEVEDGIDGLVHVSDISWVKRIKHPSEALKKGQEVSALITSIDVENRRLSLSIKNAEPNAWEKFFEAHRVGDLLKGKIARYAPFGVFVELEEGIEGLCHVSELSDQRVEKPETAVQIGQEMEFRILKLDPSQKKIGLSARAATGKEREAEVKDVRSYLNSGDSSMARLGDLASFNALSTGSLDKKEE